MVSKEPYTATYSVAIVDTERPILGVAVQSHAFAVGAIVPWCRPGVGLVLTQALANRSYGPRGLALLEDGASPDEVLDRLTGDDQNAEVRQAAVISASGRISCHTGVRCIPAAGHVVGDGFAALANMMERETVPKTMAEYLARTTTDAPEERLLGALDAAQSEGGDIRGMQSAALILAEGDRIRFDLRVDDSSEPIAELKRLVRLATAYELLDLAEESLAEGDLRGATGAYGRAREVAPEKREIEFWEALSYAATTDGAARARDRLHELFRSDSRWRALALRLPETGMIPIDSADWNEILSDTPGRIYHVCAHEQWNELKDASHYRDESLERVGFIHCAYEHQLDGVLRRYFMGRSDIVVLEIDPARVDSEMRDEDLLSTGERFPHIYGPIPRNAIVGVQIASG